ncbi:SurA N-terminal domain-containing protein [Lentibacter algarum]|uniref:SurA N-terminal domain-containing protein n=1 Tax=Lentibacter algarum TaxID=576131 RepID=UPI001C07FF14|nr:SurA N-terminal domain-containing protein [Lentibacter algarum]MBU2982429.1 SurA N-terminal domain-containing protein [Lentibacter algarum]
MAASGKTMKVLMWILMGLLIIGLGGFGVANLGGSVRSVGQVGDKPITTESYSRALQQTLRTQRAEDGRPLSFAEAQARQLDRLALAQLIATRALDHETSQLGLSVGDDILARQIVETPAFAGIDGKFDAAIYTDQLNRQRLTKRQYEVLLREETARGILEQAVFSDIPVSETYTQAIVEFIGARRSFTWAFVDETMLDEALPALDDEALKAFHEANPGRYTNPASKEISYVLLTPEMLIDEIEVDETALRTLYDERSAEFNQAERRLVERLVYNDETTAQQAADALKAATTSFENLVQERGLELSDVDMGDVTAEALGASGEAVFAAASGDIVGPLPTDLGPALFRINGVLAAQTTSFEEASAELRDELAQDRVRRVIDGRIDTIEDLLAGGATLEDIDAETDMQLGKISWHEMAIDGPTGYAAFRAAAAAVTLEDFPELITLEDGGLLALRLDGETDAALRPFAEVRADVVEDATSDALTKALSAKAGALRLQTRIDTDFASLGLTPRVEEQLTRATMIPDAPAPLIIEAFAMEKPGDVAVVTSQNKVALLRLDAIDAPDETDENLATTRLLLDQQLQSDLGQDVFQMFVTDIQTRTPTTIDQNAVNAVNSQFQ